MFNRLTAPYSSDLLLFVLHLLTCNLFSATRGVSQLQTGNLRQLHLQGAVRADQEQQRRSFLHLYRRGPERRERVTELQDVPESSRAVLRQLVPQRVPRSAHQQTR